MNIVRHTQRTVFARRACIAWLRSFAAFVLTAACSYAQQPAACSQAETAYAEGSFTAGGSLLVQCRKAGGNDSGVLLVAARALYKAERFSEAEQYALSLIAANPQSADAMYLIAHIYEAEDHPRQSLEWFTKAAALVRPKAADLRAVGLDYVLLEDYTDAIHWLRRAVEFDEKDSEAWYDLGRALMMQGDSPAAEHALLKSLQIEPRSVKAENNLGLTYEAENRNQDALAAYRAAIAWDASATTPNEQPLLNLGTLLVTLQRAVEAVPILQRAVRSAPRDVKVHEQLARALEQTGDSAGALAQMQQAVQLDAQNARLHFALGQMYRRSGHAEEARKELQLSGQLYGAHSTAPYH